MIFRNYQKTFSVIGIMAILLPAFFLAMPQKANALLPVIDAAAIAAIGAGFTAQTAALIANEQSLLGVAALPGTAGDHLRQLRLKEVGIIGGVLSWDSIAYMVAGAVLKSITNSIVEWINRGFQGQPGFITDPEAFFADAADQATGRFFKEFLSPEVYNFICSPFRINLYLFLKGLSRGGERMRCTLSTVIQNAADFGQNLTEGGWRDWAAISLSPQNDPHGYIVTSLDEFLGRQATAQRNAKTESIFNQGFLSMKKCVEYYADEWTGPGPSGQGICVRYEATSPGKWVSDTLTQATGIDMQRLAFADEINEILSALISQLLKGILRR